MRFAHIADCHIGAWKDYRLNQLNLDSFTKAIDIIISRKLDFVLLSGDLFNTSLPAVDALRHVVRKLSLLRTNDIPVYSIAGSHDFSPSGKTMLDVLEDAGLIKNVTKGQVKDNKLHLSFTIDSKTGAKITGMLGKKGGLEKHYYENLSLKALEDEAGFKIFLFHTLLSELKPKSLVNVPSEPLSFLPKGFDYYAGGHPHFVFEKNIPPYGKITYPGPLFPNNFKELSELKHGGFFIFDTALSHIPIILKEVSIIDIDATHKTPKEVEQEILKKSASLSINDHIVALRVSGTLESGSPGDIHFNDLVRSMDQNGAYAVLKNTLALQSKDTQIVAIGSHDIDELETSLVAEHFSNNDSKFGPTEVKSLMRILENSKIEGETVTTFEKRIEDDLDLFFKKLI